MSLLIAKLTSVPAAVSRPSSSKNSSGRVNSQTAAGIAKRPVLRGGANLARRPDFDEYSIVLRGDLQVERRDSILKLAAGQAIIVRRMGALCHSR